MVSAASGSLGYREQHVPNSSRRKSVGHQVPPQRREPTAEIAKRPFGDHHASTAAMSMCSRQQPDRESRVRLRNSWRAGARRTVAVPSKKTSGVSYAEGGGRWWNKRGASPVPHHRRLNIFYPAPLRRTQWLRVENAAGRRRFARAQREVGPSVACLGTPLYLRWLHPGRTQQLISGRPEVSRGKQVPVERVGGRHARPVLRDLGATTRSRITTDTSSAVRGLAPRRRKQRRRRS